MSAEAWTFLGVVIAAAISLIGVIGAWVTARAGRNASPYDKLDQRVRYLEEQRVNDVSKIEDQQTEIHGLKRRVAGVIQDRNKLVRYVNDVHIWLDAGAVPPAPTVPDDLALEIPKWIADDGDRPPPRVRPSVS